MNRETLEQLARDFAAELAIPAEEWKMIIAQAERMRELIGMLDELPLGEIEPASAYRMNP